MRYRFLILAGLIFGALFGYYLFWAYLSDRARDEALAWMENQRRLGRTVQYAGIRQWGFPYRLSLTFEKLRWHNPQATAAWWLEADEIIAHLQLWQAEHVIFDLPGAQRLGWVEDKVEKQLVLASRRFRASLVVDGAGSWLRLAADLNQPKLSGALDDWSAKKLLLHARRTGNVPANAELAIQAEGLLLPPAADGPLGREIASLKLVGEPRGTGYGKTPRDLLTSWRDSGGVIEFETIALRWGGLRLNGDGTLALDKQLRPLGAMSGEVRGAEAGIDALAAAGKMKPNEAAAAKQALALIAQKDDKGESVLPVPLAAQNGRLFLGPVPLFALPPVLPQE